VPCKEDWRSGELLRRLGVEPLHVETVLERARSRHGDVPPAALGREIALVQSVLEEVWRTRERKPQSSAVTHVFVGPPGSGKTTVLCKWMAKVVLGEGRRARAWRLDSRGANLPGLLDMYGEILGVPLEREWTGTGLDDFDIAFVDFPGINPQDNAAVARLRKYLDGRENVEVHLVLNAAYDVSVTLSAVRAFSAVLPVSDLIFTHCDEEQRVGKLWNFVLGTNFTIRFLSGGQNIPGDFSGAAPALLARK